MYDVIIIGAGVIGCAAARELSRYNLDILVLEKESDAAGVTSKANSGIVHGGYDAAVGSRKAFFNVKGQRMFDALSKELDFPFKRCGSLVLCFNEIQSHVLSALYSRGAANGLTDLRILTQAELREMEPGISDNATGALFIPDGGIVSPYEMTIAYAENAAVNGAAFLFSHTVRNVTKEDGQFHVHTAEGDYVSSILVNAAGLHSDEINNMLSGIRYTVSPRAGEYCLLDKTAGGLVRHTIFQTPTRMGKGVLVTPTADGNILIGPTSHDIHDKSDNAATAGGLAEVLEKASLSLQKLPRDKIITSFAGLRAHCEGDDFIIGESEDVKGLINFIGIDSPGLTSAPAIAKEAERLVTAILRPSLKKGFDPIRKAPPRFREMTDEQRAALIARNGDYGKIICRCENVTKGEILDAMRAPIKAVTADAIKKRTRAGMGRCQSGFCLMKLLEIIAEETGGALTDVTKCGGASHFLLEKNKTHWFEEAAAVEQH